MDHSMYPETTRELHEKRRMLAPDAHAAFRTFSQKVFADGALPPQAKRDIIAYITQTRVEPNPGGFSLGRTGPVTEGLVIFLGGLGFLVLISMWITAKRRDPRPTGPTGTERK